MDVWIVDDTGFLKQGTHSPGVQRQYTGTAGKITNCQIAVSLTVATPTQHLPVAIDLYLPESWITDAKRRQRAKIPDAVRFRTKPEIALQLIAGALIEEVPAAPVTADAAYGTNAAFRAELTRLGLRYAVGVNETTHVVCRAMCGERVVSLRELAHALRASDFQEQTWLQGSQAPLRSRFARLRVEVVNADPNEPREQELLIEWPPGALKPTHFTFSTLREETSTKELIRITKARWRTERAYEDLKGELGLDHFEGRTYVGWQHHVSAVLVCYALVVACQRRAFPPSASGRSASGSHCAAA